MGSFITLTRTWQSGDIISISFSTQPSLVRANPKAAQLYGKAAVGRGPLVYALQQTEQGATPVSDLFLRVGSSGSTELRKDAFGGMTLLKYPGFVADKPLSGQPLYAPWNESFAGGRRAAQLALSPYFNLGSRENETVETWIRWFVRLKLRSFLPLARGRGEAAESRQSVRISTDRNACVQSRRKSFAQFVLSHGIASLFCQFACQRTAPDTGPPFSPCHRRVRGPAEWKFTTGFVHQ